MEEYSKLFAILIFFFTCRPRSTLLVSHASQLARPSNFDNLIDHLLCFLEETFGGAGDIAILW